MAISPAPAPRSIADEFRTMVASRLPLFRAVTGLSDTTCEMLFETPRVIDDWLAGRVRTPKDVGALGLRQQDLEDLLAALERALSDEFVDAWAWVKAQPSDVRAFFNASRRADIGQALLRWWKRPSIVREIIEGAPSRPYPLLVSIFHLADVGDREFLEACDRIARVKLQNLRAVGAIVLAMRALQTHGQWRFRIVADHHGNAVPGELLVDAAKLLCPAKSPAMTLRNQAQWLLARWQALLPTPSVASGSGWVKVPQRVGDWPMDIRLERDHHGVDIYGIPMWRSAAKKRIANRLRERVTCAALAPGWTATAIGSATAPNGSPLDASQKAALALVLNSATCVVTGSPGTGKTSLVHALKQIADMHGMTVLGFAPTGRAARVLEERTGVVSRTIHSSLIRRGTAYGGAMPFCDIAVIDESSMLDVRTLDAVLTTARGSASRVVFLGDVDQLPAVEASDVYSDLTRVLEQLGLVARLTTNHRSTATNVVNAYWLFNRTPPDTTWEWSGNTNRHDLPALPDATKLPPEWEAAVREWVGAHIAGTGSWQVLTYTRKLTETLNTVIRSTVIGKAPTASFAVGDRVMQRQNDYGVPNLRNGDQGTVTKVSGKSVWADFGSRQVRVSKEYAHTSWMPAWAVTIHKSQGGEWDDVLVVAPRLMIDLPGYTRRLLYTAITRVVVGSGSGSGTVAVMSDAMDLVPTKAKSRVNDQARENNYNYFAAVLGTPRQAPRPKPPAPRIGARTKRRKTP